MVKLILMNIWQIVGRLVPFVKPYKRLVVFSLLLTLVGAVAAQVNPLVLRYTVDSIQNLLNEGRHAQDSWSLLLFISAILFGKQLLNIGIEYGQNMFGERIRINLSSRLSQYAVERILTYRYAYFSEEENASGNLQTQNGPRRR